MLKKQGLYLPEFEHDNCGAGFICSLTGKRSNDIIHKALEILVKLEHRGAVSSDGVTGDGAGILIDIPHKFFKIFCEFDLPEAGEYAVSNVFLPRKKNQRTYCIEVFEEEIKKQGLKILGWRDVPVNSDVLGEIAKETEPFVKQIFISKLESKQSEFDFNLKLFAARKIAEHTIYDSKLSESKFFYLPSLSTKIIIFKGLLKPEHINEYYLDLFNSALDTRLALVHQRFSTNTFPTWDLAQPFRYICHNGEINTLRGNVSRMFSREEIIKSDAFGEDIKKIIPTILKGKSDSATLDMVVELLLMTGRSLPEVMMMLVPEAWEKNPDMSDSKKAFYEYNSCQMEPWDGPASIPFTDGNFIGAVLDRNGLRPSRYTVTKDGNVIMSSETGVVEIKPDEVEFHGRLEPGKMLLIDLQEGRLIDDDEVKTLLSTAKPYKKKIKDSRFCLSDLTVKTEDFPLNESILDTQQAFGYSQEDINFIIKPMIDAGMEPSGSMGNDAALPVLSNRPKLIFNYFKQLFAQVTNPPIDPIRENIVMSLMTFIGPKPNLFNQTEDTASPRLEANQPILTISDLDKLSSIENLTDNKFKSCTIDITFELKKGQSLETSLVNELDRICKLAKESIENNNIIILSDRNLSKTRMAVPALLACSATHQYLIAEGLRTHTGLVVDTGSAKEIHHFALLAGYGAEAVCPWLTFKTIENISDDFIVAQDNYIKAVGKGLFKVMSKMGISTYQSYCGAQIFEAVGLNQDFINQYFRGTSTNIEGIGTKEIAEEMSRIHQKAFGDDPVLINALDAGGEYAFRIRGEEHMWNPDSIAKLQHATRTNQYETYKEYAQLINDQTKKHKTLRGLFSFKKKTAINLDEVESAKNIVKRFATGAMSLGSISTEAHSTLAIAMNRIGGKSNTGEGGEDKKRFFPIKNDSSIAEHLGSEIIESNFKLKAGDSMRSKIKQVASGRIGVTAEYLSTADQIQIKMAQGAKPGEGGQLPGHKVSTYIAKLRFSVPGVGLISPPPHHDIYSIEDLAQLIHDLKNANPQASISVKLVSETGVGTVAAGVAKAKSDHIVIAGHDGGTGASPISSIKHAGTPWELGLAETQQTLVLNQLRGRVVLQVDGQMKTGRDVVIGALLGAEEFGFATAPLVVEGCIMMRKCHLNTCPVGIATQDPILRKRFAGQPEHVVNFFFFVAEEIREIMASLGIKRFNDLVGRSDLLDTKKGIDHWKIQGLDFSKIFYQPDMGKEVSRYNTETQYHALDKALDNELISRAQNAIKTKEPCEFTMPISNTNRTVGTLLSHEIAKTYGNEGLPDDSIKINLEGTAGQSFGAFLAKGITFNLYGEGNDYVAKGLCGGKIVIRPPENFKGIDEKNIIIGNTVMYGATSGETYFRGIAGERFCVRNSGASAVVEGVGNHGCEYMTGGTVVVLGQTGQNFAAGMSGGVAFIYDPLNRFGLNCNHSMVTLEKIKRENEQASGPRHLDQADEKILKSLVEKHLQYTDSKIAKKIIEHWDKELVNFIKVMPNEYKRALDEMFTASNKEAA